MSPYTDDQLVAGITNALKEQDVQAVAAIIQVLAGQNPARAAEVFDTLTLGLVMARGVHGD